jgi:hypothetical protein
MRYPLLLAPLAMALALSMPSMAQAQRTPAPENALVYIIWPHDGTVISGGRFWLRMGLRNMGVAPKGVKMANVGHHHVLIDTELPPGKHTLQLLLGDENHLPHQPPIQSNLITVTVR